LPLEDEPLSLLELELEPDEESPPDEESDDPLLLPESDELESFGFRPPRP
jgi:hypothetical protein